jgi:xanthine dehydrogenase YagT iron-sulfur-binding subunit
MTKDLRKNGPDQSEDEESTLFERVTRRTFLTRVGVAGAAVGAGQLHAVAFADTAEAPVRDTPVSGAAMRVRLNVNGRDHDLDIDHGQCGACTVHVDGRRVNSCLSLAVTHEGEAIRTIEGIGQPGALHPMQAAFVEHDGFQCGYCTSGQIMSAVALLDEPYGHSDDEVKEAMSGNICRCGAYSNIVSAIQQVRRKA